MDDPAHITRNPTATLPVEPPPERPAREWPATFRSLRHRNYRFFWCGQLVSLIGTWMQALAHPLLVISLVPPEKVYVYAGVVGAIGSAPLFLFSLFGGVLADRFDKRRILICTQALFMCYAFILTALVANNAIQLWHVMLIAFISGTTMAIDMPTRQSYVKDLVGPEDLLNAIALNSTVFNGARIMGPALAGILIALKGVGIPGAFFVNGLSYIGVIGGLLAIRTTATPKRAGNAGVWHHLREGLRYVKGHHVIQPVLVMMMIYSVFGFSYFVLLPLIAKRELGLDAKHLGVMMSAVGAGALVSALLIATFAGRVTKGRILITGSLVFTIALLVLSLANVLFPNKAHQFLYFLALLPFVGGGLIMASSSINSVIQETTPDHLRGRVVSLWAFLFAGFTPLANLYAGNVAQLTSPYVTLCISGLVCLSTVVVVTLYAPRVWRQK